MAQYKGIILAGGSGSRLYPLTISTSKQLLPVYDKPMIFYPLSVLFLIGIREICIITTPQDQKGFRDLLGDGSRFGAHFEYVTQESPDGLAQAYLLAENFISGHPTAMILGDNIFYGADLKSRLVASMQGDIGCTIHGYAVANPSSFGVVEFDEDHRVVSIVEKPKQPKSNFAITGLYFMDSSCVEKAKRVVESARGELEITDILNQYFEEENLSVNLLGRGFLWFDAGTHDNLLEASNLVGILQRRMNSLIGSPEEIALSNGWLNHQLMIDKIQIYGNSEYRDRLMRILALSEKNYIRKH